jgi:hypothetical protein
MDMTAVGAKAQPLPLPSAPLTTPEQSTPVFQVQIL